MNEEYPQKIIAFHQKHKRMPTYAEMADLFSFKSKNAVSRVVDKMIAAGIVTKDRLGKLIPGVIFDEIPMVGLVKAGLPAPGDLLNDTLNVEQYLVPKKESTYLFEVDGDSMIDAHIASGDIVVAERTSQARDGDIVIAEVDGEFTMKYFRTKNPKTGAKEIWLEPANKKYKPIYPTETLTIVAVVRSVMRRY